MFSYYVDLDTRRFEPWERIVPPFKYDAEVTKPICWFLWVCLEGFRNYSEASKVYGLKEKKNGICMPAKIDSEDRILLFKLNVRFES